MLTSDTYHTSTSRNPGRVDSHSAGTAKIVTRIALDTMVGQVLPSAWNIEEQLKITPLAAKFQDVITSICTPTSTTASSRVKMCMKNGEANWHSSVSISMITMLNSAVHLKVSRTRSGLRAPKFCPA